jgi:hypothetical protein
MRLLIQLHWTTGEYPASLDAPYLDGFVYSLNWRIVNTFSQVPDGYGGGRGYGRGMGGRMMSGRGFGNAYFLLLFLQCLKQYRLGGVAELIIATDI